MTRRCRAANRRFRVSASSRSSSRRRAAVDHCVLLADQSKTANALGPTDWPDSAAREALISSPALTPVSSARRAGPARPCLVELVERFERSASSRRSSRAPSLSRFSTRLLFGLEVVAEVGLGRACWNSPSMVKRERICVDVASSRRGRPSNSVRHQPAFFELGLDVGDQLLDGHRAQVLPVKPDGLGRRPVDGVVLVELHDRVGPQHAFDVELGQQLVEGEDFLVVFRRPAEQRHEVDERLRQEAGIAVVDDADDGAVLAFGKLRVDRARAAAACGRSGAFRRRGPRRSGCA